MMLAKPDLDVGLFTNRRDEQLAFWREVAGLSFDHTLKLGGGVLQHRFNAQDSVIKVNDARHTLAEKSASGILGLVIAKPGQQDKQDHTDPDGNMLELVPIGHHGVTTIGLRLAATN